MKASNIKNAGSFIQFIEFIESCIEELSKSSDRIKKVVFNDTTVIIKKYTKNRWFITDTIDLDQDPQLIDLGNKIENLIEPNNGKLDGSKINVEKKQKKFFITKATT